MTILRKPQARPRSGATDAEMLLAAEEAIARGRSPGYFAVADELGITPAAAGYRIRQMRGRGAWPHPPGVRRPR
jgi:hypothetical protein